MAFDINGYDAQLSIRSYEISIWTLLDRFLSVLKWANMSLKGLLLSPEMTLRDDGTEELTFTIPKFYWVGPEKINNPMWLLVKKEPIEANMHKLKVIFNKNLDTEKVFEFLVVSVDSGHKTDEVDISVKAEGLAFHELGKVGYKLAFSQTDYELDLQKWIDSGARGQKPEETILYWNDKVFIDSRGNWRTNWKYEILMDWSSYSLGIDTLKDPHKVYEDEYVSSWQLDNSLTLQPKYVEGYKEKWRPIDISESNIYNITLKIAELFGVFCRYEYEHDENYLIIGRKVIYYNNYILDIKGHIDLTYPYSSTSITRIVDNSELTTKMYVLNVDNDDLGTISIMEVDANKSKEDYLLCFDYLKDIDGINEDQYAEIEKYEALMHLYNNALILILERIRIITNQLIDLEALKTTYSNAITLDEEQYNEATTNALALTDGEGLVQFDVSAVVMKNDTYGLYISLYLEGIKKNSLKLYFTNNFTALDGSLYKNPIKLYAVDMDQTGKYAIRIRNILYSGLKLGDMIYVSGTREPYTYYTELLKIWSRRKELDTNELNKVSDLVNLYNWYLTGSRADYGVVGTALADMSYMGLAITAPFEIDETELLDNWMRDYPFSSFTLGAARAGNSDDNNYTIDTFAEEDINALSADLYYFKEYYLEMKSLLSDKFERMMGPALREGYWQPDDYHDYGDMYDTTIENLSAKKKESISPLALDHFIPDSFVEAYDVDDRLAPHMLFIWDCNKYYENETAAIYDSSISGRKDLHLIVDISNCLPFIKEHLDNLCFFYSSPLNVSTIYNIEKLKIKTLNETLQTFHSGYYPNSTETGYLQEIPPDKGLSEAVVDTNYYLKLECLVNRINTTKKSGSTEYEKYFDLIKKLKTAVSSFRDDRQKHGYHIANDLPGESERPIYANVHYLSVVVENLESFADTLYTLKKAYTDINKTNTQTAESNYGTTELAKITAAHEYLVYVNSEIVSGEKALGTISTPTANNNYISQEDKGLLTILRQYLNYFEWVLLLYESRYLSFSIGSSCELGWVIDTNPIIENNQIVGYGTCKRIPVLIVTGANILDDDAIRFIMTGQYAIYNGEGLELTKTWSEVVEDPYKPFLGYYKVINSEDDETIDMSPGDERIELNLSYFLGVQTGTNSEIINIGRNLPNYDYDKNNVLRPPEYNEYRYRTVYPRIFFNTLKLKNASSELHLVLDGITLTNFEDYSVVTDDRSKGQNVYGSGYYCTIKPRIFFERCNQDSFNLLVLYTLSNADVSIYLDALKVARENAKPKVSYEVELSILNPEFIKTAYDRLNQIVQINDNDLQLEEASGYISSLTLILDKPWEDKAEIKNYTTKFEDLFSTIVAQTAAMEKSTQGLNTALQAFSRTTGLLDADVLERSMISANLKYQFDTKGKVVSDDLGIMAIAEDGSGVIAFRAGGIFTAYEKDVNQNWIWNTGILPTGINASLITTGLLDTSKIKVYAGDQLRFLLNADGLFAYKPFSIATNSSLSTDILAKITPQNDIDMNQYVVFNSEGLFLTAKKGAYRNTGTLLIEQNEGTIFSLYETISQDINRVEVSWDGLKLRNWNGEEVFYMDPDTGNLTLSGTISASAGRIGGWNIHSSALESTNSRLILNSGYGENLSPSIALSDRMLATTKIYNNVTYYIYKRVGDTNNQLYYSPILKYDELSFSDFNDELYIEGEEIISVSPKYFYIETMPRESSDIGLDDDSNLDSDLTVVTHIYIASDENGSESVIYFETPELEQPLPLEYDGDTSKDADWYQVLLSMSPPLDLNEIVTTITTLALVKANTAEHPIANNVKFTLDGVNSPVFLIEGSTTENGLSSIAIKRGQIGNFDITTNGLFNGILDSSIKIGHNGRITSLGDCITKIVSNTKAGRLEFYNAKGEIINFNVAETQFYKDAISAVQDLQVTHTVKGKTIIFKATVGNKLTGTKSITYRVTISDSGGSSGGSSDSCNSSCSGGCSDACTGTCSGSCLSSCTGGCDGSCSGSCKNSCGTACTRGCSTTCANNCVQSSR